MSQDISKQAEWTEEVETLLSEWAEKSSCYRWLYSRGEKKYRLRYYLFSIPVIILSTLTGAANVGLSSYVPEKSQSTAQAVVGGVNIFAGILSTLQNFLSVAELMEGNRIAGVAWSKLGRNISIELAIDPDRRTNCADFLTICRAEYDRLIEQSPLITDDIITEFKKKFKSYEVAKPSITNGLDKCDIYKRKTDKDEIKIIREESGERDTSLIQDALKDDRVVKQLAELAVSEPEAVSS